MIEIDELKEERITIDNKEQFQIWGGEIEQNEVLEFINSWDLSKMPYTIIETFGDIRFEKTSVPCVFNSALVKHIRIFGESGDLELINNFSHMKWRYIGQAKPPKNFIAKAKDFWQEHPTKKFFLDKREALLWGSYDGKDVDESGQRREKWYHSRVARAKLFYPIDKNPPQMVKICYKTLSENGCISFVWYTELKGGVDNE